MNINKELLEILACPRCHGGLEIFEAHGDAEGLVCHACAVVYPVRDAIPVMLTEEAVPLPLWLQGQRQVQR